MIRGFWQSRLAAGGIFGLMAAMAVVVWVRDAGMPVYIPLLATVLLLALGYAAGRLAGNIVASQVNAKYLGLLHIGLDPAAFLAKYEAVPGRLRGAGQNYAIACAYLADGYAAAGEFDRAIAALCPDFAGKKGEELSLKGLYYDKLAAYRLGKGDAAGAARALTELAGVVEAARAQKPAFAENMAGSLRLYRSWQACLAGGRAEGDWLAAELPKAPYNLRRLEILKVLILYSIPKNRMGRAREYLGQMLEQCGKTYYRAWAEQTLAGLPEQGR